MPYSSKKDLPAAVKNLPENAQQIFLKAFNSAYDQYESEEKAHAVAWAAVKNKYKKEGDNWVAKSDSLADSLMTFDEMLSMDDAAGVRITADGYMVAAPRIARTGVQVYKGWEVGRPDMDTVKVYRPEDQVFAKDAMASLAFRPITLDHPGESVNAGNWKKYAVGQASGEVARDGECVRIPMVIMDQDAIDAYKAGKAQLSVGYAANLKWGSGTSPKGEVYDAMQTSIRGNHVAMVRAARGGDILRIGDKRSKERTMTERTLTMDGVSVTVDERDAQIIERHIGQLNTSVADMRTKLSDSEKKFGESVARAAEDKKLIDTKDGEIAALKKQIEDGKITPDKLNVYVRDRIEVVERARAVLGDRLVIDGKSDAEIRRQVVAATLGDEVAKSMNDDGIKGAFLHSTKDVKVETRIDGVRMAADAFGRPGAGYGTDERGKAYGDMVKGLNDAWRTPTKTEAA